MYYATYKGIGKSDIAVFESKQERDNWVNFKDNFSLDFGVTKENATFERQVLTKKNEITKVINNKRIKKIADRYNPKQWWYSRSVI